MNSFRVLKLYIVSVCCSLFKLEQVLENEIWGLNKRTFFKCSSRSKTILIFLTALLGSFDAYAGTVSGWTDRIDNNNKLRGWVCVKNYPASIGYHVYVGGPAGSGSYVGGGTANVHSEAAVSNICGTSGIKHRFLFPISDSVKHAHAGKRIYVHGINPLGDNSLIGGSVTVPVIAPAVPSRPSIGGAEEGSVDVNGSHVISWPAVAGFVTRYEVRIQQNGSWGSPISTGGARSYSQTVGVSSVWKLYAYQVRACNTVGCSGWSSASSVSVAPSDYHTVDGWIKLINDDLVEGWICVKDYASPIRYHAYVGGPAGQGGSVLMSGDANHGSESAVSSRCRTSGVGHRFTINLSHAIKAAHGGKRLYVHGINPYGDNTFVGGLVTIPAAAPVSPAQPVVANVENGQVDTDGNYVVSWPSVVGNVSHYEVRVNQNGSWGGAINLGMATNYAQNVGVSSAWKTYTYQVRACNSVGCSNWSPSSTNVSVAPSDYHSVDGWTKLIDNNLVDGWICVKDHAESIRYHVYVDNPSELGGTFLLGGDANHSSETAVANRCRTSGVGHRFTIDITDALKSEYGGRRLYVHAINPYGKNLSIQPELYVPHLSPGVPPKPVGEGVEETGNIDTDGLFSISWGAVDGSVDYYELRAKVGSNWAEPLNVGQNTIYSANVELAGAWQKLSYEVRACNNSGCGLWSHTSDEISVVPTDYRVLKGWTDLVNDNNQISGWMCVKDHQEPLQYDVYVGAPYNQGGVLLGGGITTIHSEQAISDICRTEGVTHRFQYQLDEDALSIQAGKRLFVYGINPFGENLQTDGPEIYVPQQDFSIDFAFSKDIASPGEELTLSWSAQGVESCSSSGVFSDIAGLSGTLSYQIPVDQTAGSVIEATISCSEQQDTHTKTARVTVSSESDVPFALLPENNGITTTLPEFKIGNYDSESDYRIVVSESPRGGSENEFLEFYVKTAGSNSESWDGSWIHKRRPSFGVAAEVIASSSDAELQADMTYYWHIVAIKNGVSTKSIQYSFTVGTSGEGVAQAPAPADMPYVDVSSIQRSAEIGSIAGQFRVNESGAATYNIPIAVPAGSAGVSPQLALRYSSSGGNGLVGIGWNLQGLSAVSRCRQTLGQDKQAKAISWSSEDRFCLDGQRLLVQDGEAYGAVGAVYRTEVDSFAKVTAHGGSSGHPDYFTVKRKDGSLSYYGNSSDAKQKTSNGQSTLTWAQNRFEDNVGNGINFVYANDDNGQRIASIQYGGTNENLSEVVFHYSDRDDDIVGYVAGHLFATRKLLSDIRVLNNGQEIKRYGLEYLANSGSYKSRRLNAVEECSGSSCLPKTTFDWSEPMYSFSASGSELSLGGSHSRDLGAGNFKPADINGDGLMDVVWYYHLLDGGSDIDYVLRYALSDGERLVPEKFSDGKDGQRWNDDEGLKYEVVDYNADGRHDVVFKNSDTGNWGVYLATPQSDGNWKLSSNYIDTGISDNNVTFADFNSDGLIDVAGISGNQPSYSANIYIRYLEIDQTEPLTSDRRYKFGNEISVGYAGPTPYQLDRRLVSRDLNGDGVSDLGVVIPLPDCRGRGCVQSGDRRSLYGVLLDEAGYQLSEIYTHQVESEFFAGEVNIHLDDFNNDGIVDVLHYGSLDEENSIDVYGRGDAFQSSFFEGWHVRFNNSNTFGDALKLEGISTNDRESRSSIKIIDYDQDGNRDIVWHDVSSKKLKASLWSPRDESFEASDLVIRDTDGDPSAAHLFFDINADGINDYVVFKNDRLYTYLAEGVDASSNKIVKITNGLGAETDITYEPLGKSGHYERLTVGESSASEFCFSTDCPTYNFSTNNVGGFYSALNGDWTDTDTLGKTGPVLELNGPIAVVTQVASSAPTSNNHAAKSAISYYYAEAKIQASGRGLLGFERLKTVDEQTGVQTVTRYRQDWPFIGYPADTKVYSAEGYLLSESSNTWRLKGFQPSWGDTARTQGSAALGSLQPYIQQSIERTYGLADNGASQGSLLQAVVTDNTYDDYGNPTQIVVTTKDTFDAVVATKTTVNNYGTTVWEREMGRLSRTQVSSSRDGDTQVRTSAFTYYDTSTLMGLLKDEIIEPDRPEFTLTTTYNYDVFGNKVSALQSAAGIDNRFSNSVYDDDGRYLLSTRNRFNQVTQNLLSYNSFGQPNAVRDINGVETAFKYDGMGRKYLEYSASGAYSVTLLSHCDSDCPAGASYLAYSEQAGGSQSKTYYDILGREVRTANLLFDGSWAFVDTHYDNLGRVSRKSEPHSGTAQYWTEFDYDILGRVVSTQLPGITNAVTVVYDDLSVTTTNPKGQSKTEIKNVLGELTNVYDADGGRLEYRYDALGNLLSVVNHGSPVDPHHIEVAMTYDVLGRKAAMNDPDKGQWVYEYNAFGELVRQTDAKNQVSEISYDAMGRMVGRIDRRSDGSVDANTTWVYNNNLSGVGLGQLQSVQDSVSGFSKALTYDVLGRLSETETQLAANDSHYEKVTYDQFGRVHQNFDAAGDGNWAGSATQNHYNTYGYLSRVTDAVYQDGQPRSTYLTINAMDKRGNVTESINGNGITSRNYYDAATGRLQGLNSGLATNLTGVQDHRYSWDDLGNLTRRTDQSGSKNLIEDFYYDNLNRLAESQAIGQSAQTLTYNSIGNITHKSDVGDYRYGSQCTNGFGPHALCETSDGISYQYDANGNMVSDSSGRSLKYTTFDKPYEIVKGGHTTSFKYAPDRSRYERKDTNASGTTTTRYIGNVEKISKPGGVTEVKRYLPGGAVVTVSSATGTQTHYLHKDHLGSVDVITDESGSIVQELSFDPWGQRRSAIDWSSFDLASVMNFDHSVTTRGFTGHEMLDEVGLIHMNGRVYDARIARFLQADTFVDGVTSTQGYNRYSYIHNNPLNATDPTGHLAFGAIIAIASSIGGAVAAIEIGVAVGAAIAFVGNAAATLISGGNLGDAFVNGISAAAFTALGANFEWANFGSNLESAGLVAKFGAIGGITSVLQGGKFGHGFVSAGLGASVGGGLKGAAWFKGLDVAARVGIKAIVGGTLSEMTGGKFANGAVSAAFAAAFSESVNAGVKDANGQRAARASACAYEGGDCSGFKILDIEKDLNIDASKYQEGGFQFKALQDSQGTILAFRGTDQLSDWGANIMQGMGFQTAQYTQAIGLAGEVRSAVSGNLMFTGHSLGGGLASAAAIMHKTQAITFNAAGLHANTVGGRANLGTAGQYVNAYHTGGDILSTLQGLTPLPNAAGNRILLSPQRFGTNLNAGFHSQY